MRPRRPSADRSVVLARVGVWSTAGAFNRLTANNKPSAKRPPWPRERQRITFEKQKISSFFAPAFRAVTIDDEEAGLRRAVEPVYEAIERDPLSKKVLAEVRRLRSDVAAGANALVSCEEGASPDPGTAEVTELDGAWEACTTREELLAAGADSGEDQPDNYGCFVLEFERGQFWLYRQGHGRRNRPADGAYPLEADNRITLNLDNGEMFQFVWSCSKYSASRSLAWADRAATSRSRSRGRASDGAPDLPVEDLIGRPAARPAHRTRVLP
jgi:hypothetical protein